MLISNPVYGRIAARYTPGEVSRMLLDRLAPMPPIPPLELLKPSISRPRPNEARS